jgi:hypothetical protein
MSEGQDGRAAFRYKTAELVVAALFFLLGAVVVYDSVRLGAKWAADGPQAGYFPFYVGLIICVAGLVNFVRALRLTGPYNKVFVQTGQLKLVLAVLVPAAVFVALVGWLGIYVSGILFIGFFMRWLGKYAWWKLTAVGLGVSAGFFLIFEVWFKVPLPKGPVEALLGLN